GDPSNARENPQPSLDSAMAHHRGRQDCDEEPEDGSERGATQQSYRARSPVDQGGPRRPAELTPDLREGDEDEHRGDRIGGTRQCSYPAYVDCWLIHATAF